MIEVTGPALAMLELGDVPSGFVALDAIAKEAEVSVLAAGTVQCGRWLVAFAGELEAVQRSFTRATSRVEAAIVDSVLLPHAEPRIVPALRDGAARLPTAGDALGVLQTGSSPTLLHALDAALKGALVELVELRVAEGLGGKGLASLWGKQHDVEAAIEIAREAFGRARREGCSAAVIANADPEVLRALLSGTRFFKEFRG